jgi:ArsR family transcriptional regulator
MNIVMDKKTPITKLTALSHSGRLDIFRLLVGAGAKGLHLTMLSSAELIRSQREGRNIRYFAEMSAMRELLGYLLQDCCGGNPDMVKPALDSLRCRERELRERSL